jgi:hypothetical protein
MENKNHPLDFLSLGLQTSTMQSLNFTIVSINGKLTTMSLTSNNTKSKLPFFFSPFSLPHVQEQISLKNKPYIG